MKVEQLVSSDNPETVFATTIATTTETSSTSSVVEQPKLVSTKPVQPIPAIYVAPKYTQSAWRFAFYGPTEAELAAHKEAFEQAQIDKQATYEAQLREYEAVNPQEPQRDSEEKVEMGADEKNAPLATAVAPILTLALVNSAHTDNAEQPKLESEVTEKESRKRSRSR